MARLASKQIAGYFKTPPTLLASFASTLKLPERGIVRFLDPCAGDGEAIATLRELWYPMEPDTPAWDQPTASVVACELEAERAAALETRLDRRHDEVHHGDAFNLRPKDKEGATVCYLNPPYDTDVEHGRLEQRFLERFTDHIFPGNGFLMFLVPHHALAASAEYLARNYLDIQAWRLPAEHFATYKQVLVVARRAAKCVHASGGAEEIRAWATDASCLEELPGSCTTPRHVAGFPGETATDQYGLTYEMQPIDSTAMLERFNAWKDEKTGTEHTASDLLGIPLPTAVPPRPAHIAIALSAGQFNGKLLEPNDPTRHPPILAKGVFQRDLTEVDEKRDAEGELVGTVAVERPVLLLTILRLDTCEFHTLRTGTIPSGSDDLDRWNTADLIRHYDCSLAQVMTEQFPPLHDPRDEGRRLALPSLPRTPYMAQDDAIQAALKLIAEGRNPQILAEVGTGKTTMALYIASALSPEHYAETKRGLGKLGFDTERLPCGKKTLVVCPPHLLESWQDEASAVDPDRSVQVIDGPADLEREADIYLLSREKAKLGHAVIGVEKTCPKCGRPTAKSKKQNASRRLCCTEERREPRNRVAHLALSLAGVLAGTPARDCHVDALVKGSPVLRAVAARPAKPIRGKALRSFLDTLMRRIEAWLTEDLRTGRYRLTRVLMVAECIATVAEARDELASTLDRLLDMHQEASQYGPISQIKTARSDLEQEPEDEDDHLTLRKALEMLYLEAKWTEPVQCGEPLYQAVPKPRRFPIATLIARRYRHAFDLVIVDESHEYNHDRSAQTKALHRLVGLPGVTTVLLTGSLMGGYASALFPNAWMTNHDLRAEFERSDRLTFVKRFGFAKVLVSAEASKSKRERGTFTDREISGARRVGEAPGVHPEYITRYLLPSTVILHKSDLDIDLPELTEQPCPIDGTETETDAEVFDEYMRLQEIVLERIKKDRFVPDRAGKLLGALVELPSYLDRCTSDLDPYEIIYPAVGDEPPERIATALVFPRNYRTPKERFLVAKIRERLADGENILVFLRHTGTPALPNRLMRLIGRHATSSCAWLDARKVPTAKRQHWIEKNVIEKSIRVLLVNPNAVRTGLNCLTRFSSVIWHQLDYSATTYRQANGRAHRIGQTRPVWVGAPYIVGTAQQIAFELVASKVSASLQVDGLDLQAALEAAGASDAEAGARAAAMSLGESIYRRLVAGEVRRPDAKPRRASRQKSSHSASGLLPLAKAASLDRSRGQSVNR